MRQIGEPHPRQNDGAVDDNGNTSDCLGGLFFANKEIVKPGENESAYNAVEKGIQNAHDQVTEGP